MSEQDEGHGGNAGPTLEFESDFAGQFSSVHASGDQPWSANPHQSHRSEDPLMSSGSGRPAQPAMGQRSIFGTGRGPVFAQVPSYTPVTRAPEPIEQPAPQPPRQAYPPQGGQGGVQTRPASNQPRVAGYSEPQSYPGQTGDHRSTQDYTTQDFPAPDFPPQDFAPQSYPSQDYASPYPAQTYQPQPQTRQRAPAPNIPAAAPAQPSWARQPNPAPQRQAPPPQPQSFQPRANPMPANEDNRFPDRIFPGQAAPSAAPGHFGDQSFGHTSFPETNFTDAGFDDASFPGAPFQGGAYQEEPAEEPSYQQPSFQDASFEDASYPEELADAEFSPEAADDDGFEEAEPLQLGVQDASFDVDQDYDPMAEQGDQYGGHHGHEGASPGYSAIPSHQALQSFDAVYDQPPQIPLGATSAPGTTQNFYEAEQPDADFLDDSQFEPGLESVQPQPGRKLGLRSRSMFMVGSALLGAVALGGALAFAYKQSGGSMSAADTPVVQADTRPVKEAPQDAGGKDFPHKNKLIYERLQNGDQPEAERIVPRQEELAMPAMPGSSPVGAEQAGGAPAVATVDDPDGGPRRVKTLIVRPDGSVAQPPAAEAAPAPPQQVAAAAPEPQPAPQPQAAPPPAPVADPQPVAAIPKPKPVAAAAAPAPAAPSQYVVQVGSKQNQTDALATFADMQQKYPTLLASYRPMVQKANLGAKGIWYRLRIGPISDKSAASKLCGQLKSQGHPDCLVMAAQ
jgi:cell division septation protein DedD